jgi:hypothetical protein
VFVRCLIATTIKEKEKILVMNEYEYRMIEKKNEEEKKFHCSTLTIELVNIDLCLFFFLLLYFDWD